MNYVDEMFIKSVSDRFRYIDGDRLRPFGYFAADVCDFIGCQFALESDYGTSELAITYHNFSGMKLPKHRKSFANNVGSGDRFSHYDSVELCIRDYLYLIKLRKPSYAELHTIDNFMNFLVRIKYCPEPDYTTRILNIYNQFTYGKTK